MLASIQSNSSSVQLLAANASRENFIIINEATTALYIAFKATSSTSSFTTRLDPGDFYESSNLVYTGVISGIWAGSPTGYARITEV